MRAALLKVLAPMAGLAMVTMPGVVTPVVTPNQTQCVGGACDLCPAVATVAAAAGAELYCIA
ncbi:hypothetical protein [Sporichthya polymorpha]|uniref:hypothetical protein n=1 Tax=Sporichthya polymorpha TaxID=35751 RepID=UPI0003604BBB|nr:hypothetical protein [Sporichthya polymorpha]